MVCDLYLNKSISKKKQDILENNNNNTGSKESWRNTFSQTY